MSSLLYLTLVTSCIIGPILCCHLLYLIIYLIQTLSDQRPNLKNLRRGLNLSCGSNMVGSMLKIVFNFSRIKPALNWNWFLEELRRGLNSFNSDTERRNCIILLACTMLSNKITLTFMPKVLNSFNEEQVTSNYVISPFKVIFN